MKPYRSKGFSAEVSLGKQGMEISQMTVVFIDWIYTGSFFSHSMHFFPVSSIFPLSPVLKGCEDRRKRNDGREGKVSKRDNMMQP